MPKGGALTGILIPLYERYLVKAMDILQWIRDEADKLDCEALANIESAAVIAAIIATEFDGGASVPAWIAIQSALTAAWAVQGCGGPTPEWPDDRTGSQTRSARRYRHQGKGSIPSLKGTALKQPTISEPLTTSKRSLVGLHRLKSVKQCWFRSSIETTNRALTRSTALRASFTPG